MPLPAPAGAPPRASRAFSSARAPAENAGRSPRSTIARSAIRRRTDVCGVWAGAAIEAFSLPAGPPHGPGRCQRWRGRPGGRAGWFPGCHRRQPARPAPAQLPARKVGNLPTHRQRFGYCRHGSGLSTLGAGRPEPDAAENRSTVRGKPAGRTHRLTFAASAFPTSRRHPVISRCGRARRRSITRWPRIPGPAGSGRHPRRRGRILPLLRACPQRRRPPQAQRAHRAGDGGRRDAGGADQGDRHRRVVRADARGVRGRCHARHGVRRRASRPSTGTAGQRPRRRGRADRRQRRSIAGAVGPGRSRSVRPHRRPAGATASSSAAPRRIPRSAPTPTSSSCCPRARWPRRIATTR